MKTQDIIRKSIKEQELKNYIVRKHLPSGTIITDELNIIKEWVKKFQGKPIKWIYTNKKHTIEIIELSFEDQHKYFYQEVTWDQWYEIFKMQQLKFIFIQPARDEEDKRFYMLSKQINDQGIE